MTQLMFIKPTKKKRMTQRKTTTILASVGLAFAVCLFPWQAEAKNNPNDELELTYLEEFGKRLFFENISDPERMSCSTCHSPSAGGTNGHSGTNLKQVAVTGADPNGENGKPSNPGTPNAGALKPPTNKYAQFLNKNTGEVNGLPPFGDCSSPSSKCGGAFWNGRAKGDSINPEGGIFADLNGGDYESDMYIQYLGPVTDQAHASPFINPVEQGHDDKTAVCQNVAKTKWGAELYKFAWNKELNCDLDKDGIDIVFARFAVALGAWQMSYENNPFNSKRDNALKNDDDELFPLDDFTEQENLGHDLFYGVAADRADLGFGQARCFFCHLSDNRDGTGEFERYTDDSYHNIGVPRNYELPGSPLPNEGLSATTGDKVNHEGLHKTPTLRNVDMRPGNGFVKAYTHNGWFKNLETLVHFYNTASIKDRCDADITTAKDAWANNCWPVPEFEDTSAIGFVLGNLKLTPDDEAAIVAYLKTLTDTSVVKLPKPYKSAPYDHTRLSH
ncbi:methylamine utilization protein [Photobacterium sagamiensis]|uniref:cytochrome-c peroxidase n=1 Tax=Photobacterium sagamiensis TaxID=2910241 RepID=UPI003D11D778